MSGSGLCKLDIFRLIEEIGEDGCAESNGCDFLVEINILLDPFAHTAYLRIG